MEPLTIALVVLVIVGVWAVVELALVLRRTRRSVETLTDAVSDTIGEVRPVIAKLDGAVDELAPASREVEPMLKKASTTIDLVNVDLVRLEGILSDVNAVTDTGARVSGAVTGAAESVASGVASAVGKVADKVTGPKRRQQKLAGQEMPHLEAPQGGGEAPASEAPAPRVEHVTGDSGYFTYPAADGAAADDAAADDAATGAAGDSKSQDSDKAGASDEASGADAR
ncbi:hypothetical protein [uncultured Parolsenella sp.]|uniref:hypothetical protein n=1 Tax=uncultured Parolsenella sp. TaxID=2083008 RepID=UPI0027D96A7C|nr:hypothetical protein [uncultured Parolsenella sp.]